MAVKLSGATHTSARGRDGSLAYAVDATAPEWS
jgi:hypothetical protein